MLLLSEDMLIPVPLSIIQRLSSSCSILLHFYVSSFDFTHLLSLSMIFSIISLIKGVNVILLDEKLIILHSDSISDSLSVELFESLTLFVGCDFLE